MIETLALNQATSLREIAQRMAKICLLLGVFLLPLSTYLTNKILIAGIIFVLFSANWKENWELLKLQRTTGYILVLSLMIIVGVFYSGGGLKDTLNGCGRYNKVLYFIFFLPLLTQQHYRDLLINAYVLSCVISVILIMGNLGEQPLINAIDSGFLVGFAGYIVMRKFIDGGNLRWLYGALTLFIGGYLLFYNVERSGVLMFFGAVVTLFWQYFRWRGLLIGATIVFALAGSLYKFNSALQQRVHLGVAEARSYFSPEAKASRTLAVRWGLYSDWKSRKEFSEAAEVNYDKIILPIDINFDLFNVYLSKQGMLAGQRWLFRPFEDIKGSSIGLRLGFMQYSWQEIKKHPWFGNGTGSFRDIYWKTGGPTIDGQYLPHPHNEYILFWFQYGIVGLIIFIFWQITMWRESFTLPKNEQSILQCLLVCFAILGFCNASFTVNPSGNVLMLFSTILLAAKPVDARRGFK